MSLPPEAQLPLDNFDKVAAYFERALGELTCQYESLDNALSNLSAFNAAKLQLMVAFSANSVYWAYLCNAGNHPASLPIKDLVTKTSALNARMKKAIEKTAAALNTPPPNHKQQQTLQAPAVDKTGEAQLATKHASRPAVSKKKLDKHRKKKLDKHRKK